MTFVDEGDIVFITSDGVSDNFDPVVGKFCVIDTCMVSTSDKENDSTLPPVPPSDKPAIISPRRSETQPCSSSDELKNNKNGLVRSVFVQTHLKQLSSQNRHLPIVSAHQRHELMLLRMDDLIEHGLASNPRPASTAKQLVLALIEFATQLTK
jgi:hypothetical protein